MRIAVFSTAHVPSRTANSIQVLKVCQAMLDLGHELRLWLPGPDPHVTWSGLAQQYGVRGPLDITWCPTLRLLRRYDYALTSLLQAKRWGADVHYTWPLQSAALAARLGVPTVLELHEMPRGRLGPRLFRAFLRGRGARRLLPITAALRDLAVAAYPIPRRPGFVLVAPMGVDLERYRDLPAPSEARQQLGWPEAFTVGYTGHLYAGRGVELLLDLAERRSEARFILAGGESRDVERWSEEAKRRGIRNLALLGFVENSRLPSLQAACDILVMPYGRRISVSGGGDTAAVASPMKLFEYLASGRPIMASDLPVFREVLSDENAVLLPPDDLEAWDRALGALMEDASRRATLGDRGRHSARQYTWIERARRSLTDVGPEVG